MKKTRIFLLITCLLLFSVPAQAAPTMDGTIAADEFANTNAISSVYDLYWTIDGDTIYFGIEVTTTGWVAIGFDPTTAMLDADMYFGYLDGTATAIDAYSEGNFGPHPKDTDYASTDDILDFGVTEADGKTIFEFSRKLDTGDATYDKVIEDKDTTVLWSYGSSDDWESMHTDKGSVTINFFAEADSDSPFYFFPLVPLMLALIVRKKSTK